MKWTLFASLATVALSQTLPDKLDQDTLDACAAAFNCETYDTPDGTMIRFVSGMGPGSANFTYYDALATNNTVSATDPADVASAKTSRITTHTHVTMGDQSTNFGTLGAAGPHGAYSHLHAICTATACKDSTVEIFTTTAVNGGLPNHGAKLALTAQGEYNKGQGSTFINAVVQAAGKGQRCKAVVARTPPAKPPHGIGKRDTTKYRQCRQTGFININRFVKDNKTGLTALQGFITAHVRLEQESNFCSLLNGIFGAIAGVVAAVPGNEVGGSIAAGFFGIVGANCN